MFCKSVLNSHPLSERVSFRAYRSLSVDCVGQPGVELDGLATDDGEHSRDYDSSKRTIVAAKDPFRSHKTRPEYPYTSQPSAITLPSPSSPPMHSGSLASSFELQFCLRVKQPCGKFTEATRTEFHTRSLRFQNVND